MMKCFDTYYSRFNVAEAHIPYHPDNDLHSIVVIPCFNEPDITIPLNALTQCAPTQFPVEIIVVVNSPENAPDNILKQNLETLLQIEQFAKTNTRNDIKIYSIHAPNLPRKHAGVGFARKIGMDEAVRRFGSIERKDGVIINFDADCTCNAQYLSAIESYFINNPKKEGASISFEHPKEGLPPETASAIAKYELYIRYFVEAQRYAGFPYAYHTVGSAFAVRAEAYAAVGGMNRRQAGEDFYFLQKIIPRMHYGEINDAVVYPSPRYSNRVPFGTGVSVEKICAQNGEYKVYNPAAFEILRRFFSTATAIRQGKMPDIDPILDDFLKLNDFYSHTQEMVDNSTSERTFMQRFFTWFDAFRMIKFLNYAHEEKMEKNEVEEAVKRLRNLTPSSATVQ